MKETELQIIPQLLLKDYCNKNPVGKFKGFDHLQESDLSVTAFSFYTSVSAVFSSKIEGEDIEMDSFIKHKLTGAKFKPDYTQKIDDLYDTYIFAQSAKLDAKAIIKAHKIITKHILHKSQQGRLRTDNMYVITPDAKIEYVACPPSQVEKELTKLYNDVTLLLNTEMDMAEAFYFASFIHLVFVKIHPFYDGNGRTARLLEKWFLAQKLGPKVWFLQSEKYYYEQHTIYYKNIRLMGLEYELLDYNKALPFLQMLPQALKNLA